MKLRNVVRKCTSEDFVEVQTFYCHECDSSQRIVHSDDPTTGSFYLVIGHLFQGEMAIKPGTQQVLPDYEPVLFALCKDCLEESKFDDIFDYDGG